MKIAISATGNTLDTDVDSRFGRCQHLIIADTEEDKFEAVDNSNTAASGGAGVATAQVVIKKGVEAILTGNCGPNAHKVFSAAGVKV
jgi:predicted Fe-Mo cluster-binding NifX family protein